MAVSTTLSTAVSVVETGTHDNGTPTITHSASSRTTIATGTSNNQNDLVWSDERTITASNSETLDLNALTGVFGTVNFVEIASLSVFADSTNTNNVVIGAAAANQFIGPFGGATHTIALGPGASIALKAPAAGWASTNGASDSLKIANSGAGTSVVYKIIITGRSA